MDKENCNECDKELVLGEKKQCVYCELNQLKINSTSLNNTNCGICNIFTIRNKKSLKCELCKSWYHNLCNEFALDDRYCSLVFEAPKNIKWFCDKCIWETEKWINEYNFNNNGQSDYRTEVKDSEALNCGKLEDDIVEKENNIFSNKKDKRKIIHNSKTGLKRKKGRQIDTCKKVNIASVSPQTRAIKNKVGLCTRKFSKKTTRPSVLNRGATYHNDSDTAESNEAGEVYKEINESKELTTEISESKESYVDIGQSQKEINTELEIKKESISYDQGSNNSKVEAKNQKFHPGESDIDLDCLGQDKKCLENRLIHNKKKNAQRKSNKNPFHCNRCPKTFFNEQLFEVHKLRHTDDKIPYKCLICKKGFRNKGNLKDHMMNHSNEKQYICDICGKAFKRPGTLKRHISNFHSEEKQHSCPECDFSCRLKRSLKTHMNTHKDPELTKLQCSECDYKTMNRFSMKSHMITHSDEKPIICDECGKQFKRLASLKNHKLWHSSEKPFKCKVCDKGFKSPLNLKEHQFVHNKVKNVFCSVCGFGFINRSKLTTHVKTVHSDEKPFECERCGNKYKFKHNLKHHQKGIRGTCHESNNAYKQKIQSLEQNKASFENNMSESTISDSGLFLQHTQHIPPLLVYTGGNSESIAPVYSSSQITATIHCPPPTLSIITGKYVG